MSEIRTTFKFYLYAVLAPPVATGLSFAIESHLHRGNISLVYLLAVLVVAVRTSTKPALVCALISFLMYNFFFTEPRYTLLMMHREDILTVGFFLFLAALTGHQAARLRQQLVALQSRSVFAKIQLDLLEQLASAIDNQQVYTALNTALSKIIAGSCFVIESDDNGLNMAVVSVTLSDEDEIRVRNILAGKSANGPELTEKYQYYPLHDGKETVAVIGFARSSFYMTGTESNEMAEAMIQQACLALGRNRLVQDVQKERFEKERELLRSALLSSVSHDLRTPLASMIGSASSLLELKESLSESQQTELLEAIQQEARRLDSYTQNLLDMTRLGYGELRLERDWIGLGEIMSVIIRRIKPSLRGQSLNISIASDLPLLYVHAALLEQAIYNVLDNARKYSPAGSTITVGAKKLDQYIVIDIADEGPGIPAAERENVFDMFYTVNSSDRHRTGTGLGLAICKGMIGAHGGEVKILDNKNGKGCTVRIRLPINIPPARSDD